MKKLFIQIIGSLLIVFSSSFSLFGQEKVIQGMVTTFDSIPLINASILVKSSKELVYSDSIGMFTVSCLPKDRIKVTARGFTGHSIRIKENTKYVLVNLRLQPGPESRELAVGYGHVSDVENLYAISNVNENDMDFSHYRNIYDIISDRFTSVQVRGDGELVIRNTQTLDGNSSNAALLIVDGRQVDAFVFGSINTVDIGSINVLKDASAAVYGSRGGNGVVIVETKRGTINK
ncbi:TonB-dependent receptor plug domain-containing protein [Bacteroidota bacterium]